jgi:hypothetical protein
VARPREYAQRINISTSNPLSLSLDQYYDEYNKMWKPELEAKAAAGDIRVKNYLDVFQGCNETLSSGFMSEKTLKGVQRAAGTGCPVAQLNLADYLSKMDNQDENVRALYMASAKTGLIESHFGLGKF